MTRRGTVQTTLGELVVALTEETARFVPNEREANILVAYMLTDLFSKSNRRFRIGH